MKNNVYLSFGTHPVEQEKTTRLHYDLALAILHEEIEHEAWCTEFLGEDPSAHFLRPSRQNSSYVSKFLH